MLGNAAYLESSRRESRKRRRVSERRRAFSRLNGPTADHDFGGGGGGTSFSASRDRRRSSNLTSRQQTDGAAARSDSPTMLMACGDQGKISMKIQFHITVAPDNEPLILDTYQLQSAPAMAPATAPTSPLISSSTGSAKRLSTDQTAIGEQLSELLNRQNSSTRRRQHLLALHKQSALDTSIAKQNNQQHSSPSFQSPTTIQLASSTNNNNNLMMHSDENLKYRSSSMSDNYRGNSSVCGSSRVDQLVGREAGVRSSTITDGMQDEATKQFLAKQQRQPFGGAVGSGSVSGSLIGQHQTLMSSSSNIRQRLEQREHIYFKRDGQRFGHEFTLKLSVDKNYRCLLKVRPLIPLQAITIQGHHVSFVDCSSSSSFSSSSSSSGIDLSGSMSSSAPASSTTLNGANSPLINNNTTTTTTTQMQLSSGAGLRHQSVSHLNGLSSNRHNSIGPATNLVPASTTRLAGANNHNHLLNNHYNQLKQNHDNDSSPIHRRLHHAQTTVGAGSGRRISNINSDASIGERDSAMTGSVSLVSGARTQLEQQLLKQQQHNQMVRYFSAAHCSSSSSHLGGQLVYMFDWSAGRFEVTKNKARTQVQTTLKFKNGQILSLPLQVKFYQPECRQHLSWGNQLHFIDYDCNIDSMGQINVDRIQYY